MAEDGMDVERIARLIKVSEDDVRKWIGERQRIGIARIFLRDPDLCLMDEPSSTLDAQHEKELLHTLKTEYGKKISCFNVSGFIPHF